jgi:hypothetical protein
MGVRLKALFQATKIIMDLEILPPPLSGLPKERVSAIVYYSGQTVDFSRPYTKVKHEDQI